MGYIGEDYAAVVGGTDGGMNDYNVYLSASYSVMEGLSIGASLKYSDAIDDDVLPEGAGACDTNVYGGFSVYYDF